MENGIELHIQPKQTHILTPVLIQQVRLLGMTRQELEAYIADELDANPFLEAEDVRGSEDSLAAEMREESDEDRGMPQEELVEGEGFSKISGMDDFDWGTWLSEREYDDVSYTHMLRAFAERAEAADTMPIETAREDLTLHDFLTEQLASDDLASALPDVPDAELLMRFVIESLDENGFLTMNDTELAKLAGVCEDEMRRAVDYVRGYEPAGVGARDLADCLILQLERRNDRTPGVRRIVQDCLPDVAAGRIARIAANTGFKKTEVETAVRVIRSLEPRPGRGFADNEETVWLIPDVIVTKGPESEGYEICTVRAGLPLLSLSPIYLRMMRAAKRDSEEYLFLRERLSAAERLIKNLEQREQTIYNVTNVILQLQRPFFEKGKSSLRPLTMKQVAEKLGIHESTVSRTVRGKYMQTPQGSYELRYFFGAGVPGADGLNDRVSAERVRTRIAALITAENVEKPLSDERIAELLCGEGIFVSRRTVAKYRDEAGILSSRSRRIERSFTQWERR